MWDALHLAMILCALRHWKRVSMPPITQIFATLYRGLTTFLQGQKPLALRRKTLPASFIKTESSNLKKLHNLMSDLG